MLFTCILAPYLPGYPPGRPSCTQKCCTQQKLHTEIPVSSRKMHWHKWPNMKHQPPPPEFQRFWGFSHSANPCEPEKQEKSLVQLLGAIQLPLWNHNIYFAGPCLCLVRHTASCSTGTGSVPSSTTDFPHLSGKKSLRSTSEKMLHSQLQTFDLTPGPALSSAGQCKHCWLRLGHFWNPDLMGSRDGGNICFFTVLRRLHTKVPFQRSCVQVKPVKPANSWSLFCTHARTLKTLTVWHQKDRDTKLATAFGNRSQTLLLLFPHVRTGDANSCLLLWTPRHLQGTEGIQQKTQKQLAVLFASSVSLASF